MLSYARQCSRSNVSTRRSSDGHPPALAGVLELPVISRRPGQHFFPAVASQLAEHLSNLHRPALSDRPLQQSSEPIGGVLLERIRNSAVVSAGDRDAGVTELAADHRDISTTGQQQGTLSGSEIVPAELRQPCPL